MGLGLFFGGGGGGAGIQCNATLTQSIALWSAIFGRENSIAGGLFVLFCLFCFFGGGGRGIDYPNYAPHTVSQKILAQLHFWFVLLYVVV